MNRILIIGAICLAVLVAAAGGFWGGMAYQSNRADQARANFANARGLASGGQRPEDFPFSSPLLGGEGGVLGDVGARGGGVAGEVKAIDGNVLTLSTAQDVTTVNLSESTQFEKSVAVASSEIQPGMRVMVTGQRDSDGEITASQVTILNDDVPTGIVDPSAPGTEP